MCPQVISVLAMMHHATKIQEDNESLKWNPCEKWTIKWSYDRYNQQNH